MPFAGEYREAMGFPAVGDHVGGFTIEELNVGHEGAGPGRYEYPTEMVVSGKGGKEGVRKAFQPLFSRQLTIFTGFGNPYHCTGGRPAVESLGDGRYRVTARGIGTRVHLREELVRFLGWMDALDLGGHERDPAGRAGIVEGYLRAYWDETRKPRGGWWPEK